MLRKQNTIAASQFFPTRALLQAGLDRCFSFKKDGRAGEMAYYSS